MSLKKEAKKGLLIYAILDRGAVREDPAKALKKAFRKRCDFVQLRDKSASTKEFLTLSRKIGKIVKGRKKTFLINDRVDIAKAVGADGAHLGKGDFPVKLARRLLGPGAVIGKTAHTLEEALRAEKQGADYVSIGPIFKTPFKKRLEPRGIDFAIRVRKRVTTPIFCVGGINSSNIKKFRNLSISGVAMMRGIFHDSNRKS